MLSAAHLEIAAQGLIAVLGVWLGLTVLTRFATPAARSFAFLALAMTLWSCSIIVERLSTSAAAIGAGHGVEELTTGLILPALAHLSLIVATEGRPTRRQLRLVALAYLLNVAFALPGAIDPSAPVAIDPPQLVLGPIPGVVLGWARLGTRLAVLVVSVAWLVGAVRRTAPGDARRRQLGVTLVSVTLAGVGGSIRLVSEVVPTDPWIGLSLVAIAMVLAASVVFSPGFFFAAEVAGRAFWTSLSAGLALFLLAGLLLAADAATRQLLGLDAPLPTILVLMVTVAVYEPVTGWARDRLGGGSPTARGRRRLFAALGLPTGSARAATAGVQPALTRVASALDLAGATVVLADGSVAAAQGATPDPGGTPAISLVAEQEVMGELRLGPTLSGQPLSPRDDEVLRLSAAYLAAALRTGRREDEQAATLTGLSRERLEVESAATDLHEALVRRTTGWSGLRVFALGPLHVDRDGVAIERWGGEKAGTRQALALFAFLFDRGERGVGKDEVLELIWPDTDVDRADLAFHRTLGGLRRTLDGQGDRGRRAVRFTNDRYRLDPGLIEWSDVATFLSRLDAARTASPGPDRQRLLEEARRLYRGEYLDDCPFYGDSVHVEERRASLRGRAEDLLVALGEGYEAAGDRTSAAAAYRDAASISADGSATATAALARPAAPSRE